MATKMTPNGMIGADVPRVDAFLKVTGRARYGDDQRVERPAYAYLVVSTIARGRVRTIDERAARAIGGVLEILTHRNVGNAVAGGKPMVDGGQMATGVAPLATDRVHFAGQIVAVVVAETFEVARAAAAAIRVRYDAEPPAATFGSAGTVEVKAKALGKTELKAGDFDGAFAAAPVTIDANYETPPQHHNPMELFQTTCVWEDGKLTVYESTQSARGNRQGLSKQLGLNAKKIRVLSPFIGGAFGSRGELAQSTALVALAAMRLNRPVRLVATRTQGFTLRTYRAETRQRVRLAADRAGRLQALSHDGWELTSRNERFALAGIEATVRLYACANVAAKVMNVRADRQTPGFMRAPPELPYVFAIESAIDELAHALSMDPIELRRRNDATHEPIDGLPYSSRSLMKCFDVAAEAFDWNSRNPAIGAMRDGEWLVGSGCAATIYPTQMGPATCRVTLAADAHATVEVGGHDIGTGAYTVIAQTAADRLGLRIDQVTVRLGDSDLPAAPLSAGSSSTASICTVVAKGCDELAQRVTRAASKAGPMRGAEASTIRIVDGRLVAPGHAGEPLVDAVARLGKGKPIVVEAVNNPDGSPPLIGPLLVRRGVPLIIAGTQHRDRVQFAWGAHCVEVRVHRHTGEIRVSRMVGAFAGGRIVNPRTARSQLMGAQIWGLSAAIMEGTEIDRRSARYVNDDLAEYHVPTFADVASIETILVPEEDDKVNPLGIKGIGELGNVGVNAAVANAIFHATGVRVRRFPIRSDDLLGSEVMAK